MNEFFNLAATTTRVYFHRVMCRFQLCLEDSPSCQAEDETGFF